MDIYAEEVMDHYEKPRNHGEIHSVSSGQVMEGRDANASCGDMVQFSLKIGWSQVTGHRLQVIKEVKWKGIGCAISTAAASKLSEYLQGRTLKAVREMSEKELAKKGIGFEVNPGRIKCLMLPVKVVKKLLGGQNDQ